MTLAEKFAAAREAAAVAPLLRRGILRLTGADRQGFLHRMSTQDVAALKPGQAAYGAFLTAKGHLVGEGTILVREGEALVDVDPAAAAETLAHLRKFVIMDDVEIEDASEALRVVAALGPAAVALARERDLPRAENGRRGAPALDVYLPPPEAEALRAALLSRGAAPLDEGDLEALRIDAGVPRFGAELGGSHLPMEAGLTRTAIHFGKGCYIGQEIVLRATMRGAVKNGLVQLALPAGAAAGAPLRSGGEVVGQVTSAAETPSGRIGLGYVRRAHWSEGARLETDGGEAVVRKDIVQDGPQ